MSIQGFIKQGYVLSDCVVLSSKGLLCADNMHENIFSISNNVHLYASENQLRKIRKVIY